jgi:hypothetical protein
MDRELPNGVVLRKLTQYERDEIRPRAHGRWAQYVVIRPTPSGDKVRTYHVSQLGAMHTATQPVRQR